MVMVLRTGFPITTKPESSEIEFSSGEQARQSWPKRRQIKSDLGNRRIIQ